MKKQCGMSVCCKTKSPTLSSKVICIFIIWKIYGRRKPCRIYWKETRGWHFQVKKVPIRIIGVWQELRIVWSYTRAGFRHSLTMTHTSRLCSTVFPIWFLWSKSGALTGKLRKTRNCMTLKYRTIMKKCRETRANVLLNCPWTTAIFIRSLLKFFKVYWLNRTRFPTECWHRHMLRTNLPFPVRRCLIILMITNCLKTKSWM